MIVALTNQCYNLLRWNRVVFNSKLMWESSSFRLRLLLILHRLHLYLLHQLLLHLIHFHLPFFCGLFLTSSSHWVSWGEQSSSFYHLWLLVQGRFWLKATGVSRIHRRSSSVSTSLWVRRLNLNLLYSLLRNWWLWSIASSRKSHSDSLINNWLVPQLRSGIFWIGQCCCRCQRTQQWVSWSPCIWLCQHFVTVVEPGTSAVDLWHVWRLDQSVC